MNSHSITDARSRSIPAGRRARTVKRRHRAVDSAAPPLCRSFSPAQHGQRTLTRSPADTHPVASPAPGGPPLGSAPAGGASPPDSQAGAAGSRPEEGAGRRPLRPAPRTVPGGGCAGGAEHPRTPDLLFLRLRPAGGRAGGPGRRRARRGAAEAAAGRGRGASWSPRPGARSPAPAPAPAPDWRVPPGAAPRAPRVSAIKAAAA
ncbi:hypothetical protein HPG69_002274 [Diceros bicornis minor]|uniref:Uncharacterized protein n=1 Tax=Diceros bicornis minor TaxID=77932 RepID=A0A7J7FCN7_DICBM|nr:hypothetical protein HPG69_002274 [Diceros bicornis minor]